ncbi:hypothetical protein BDR07DRAFT_1380860 [Suillus spraguei]|nr:hypothetical protein BDR07DRAFT_1380860 [Suillus spraguei]
MTLSAADVMAAGLAIAFRIFLEEGPFNDADTPDLTVSMGFLYTFFEAWTQQIGGRPDFLLNNLHITHLGGLGQGVQKIPCDDGTGTSIIVAGRPTGIFICLYEYISQAIARHHQISVQTLVLKGGNHFLHPGVHILQDNISAIKGHVKQRPGSRNSELGQHKPHTPLSTFYQDNLSAIKAISRDHCCSRNLVSELGTWATQARTPVSTFYKTT